MMTPEKYWEEVGKRILGRSGGVRISLPEGLTVDELREFIDSRHGENIRKGDSGIDYPVRSREDLVEILRKQKNADS